MYPLFPLTLAAFTASIVSADRVLVLGKYSVPLWHESSSSSTFSTAGLVDLALNSLGLRTGRVLSRPAVQNPLQADIFTQSEVYAVVMIEDESIDGLETVNAQLNGANVFHKLYPADICNVKVPMAIVHDYQAKYRVAAHCAGNAALCASLEVTPSSESVDLVQQVLNANSFLSSRDDQDLAFAMQLAQVMQLTDDLEQHGDDKRLYVVGLSSPYGDKQQLAQKAVTKVVTDFLDQLMKTEQAVAAQIMISKLPTASQQVVALSRRVRNRKLASSRTYKEDASGKNDKENEEVGDEEVGDEGSGEEELDEEQDDVDLDAASGSMSETDDDSTSLINSPLPTAVSMPDIAEYQIILWTSVLLGALLLGAVIVMANMDTGRDSLLYAKFIADVNGRKTN